MVSVPRESIRCQHEHTESRKRDMHWACAEGVGDTVPALHVDGKCLELVLNKDQCFFQAGKAEVWVKESPDLGGTQRTGKSKPSPWEVAGIAVGEQRCHGPGLGRHRWDQEGRVLSVFPSWRSREGAGPGVFCAGENGEERPHSGAGKVERDMALPLCRWKATGF